MDRLPATRHIWILVLLISLGGFFEIYDLIFTGYIAPGMAKSGLLQTTTAAFFGFQGIGAFIAATFAGLFIGTFFLGWLPDKYGRRTVFTYSLLWYCVASAIMAFQTTSDSLLLWRFIAGIGVGVELVTIDTYITELVPQHLRGRAIAFNNVVMFLAAPIAALLSYWLVDGPPLLGLDGWRWVVLIGCMGAVLVWFIRLGLPDSPRWLANKGRLDQAKKVVDAIEAKVQQEFGAPLPPVPPAIPSVRTAAARFADMWVPPYRSRVLMLIAFNFCQAIGYYGFANWVPTLLINQGITVTKSLLYSFIIAIALPVGSLLTLWYADKVQRKTMIVGAALTVIVVGLLFSQAKAAVPLIVLGVLISFAGQTMSAAFHAYQPELFPTAIRCRASGFVYSASRLGGMLSGFVIAYLLRNYGVLGVFTGITGCMLVVAISIGVFGPKTKGVRLEELSH
jgi:putative MFS transporter